MATHIEALAHFLGGVFAVKSPNVGETCRLLIAGHGRRSLNSAALQPGRRSRSLFFSLRQSFNLTRLCTFMAGRTGRNGSCILPWAAHPIASVTFAAMPGLLPRQSQERDSLLQPA